MVMRVDIDTRMSIGKSRRSSNFSYPVTAPPPGVTTLIVDAASPAPVRARNGTPEAPYRSPTEALQVLRNGQAPQVHTVFLRAGRYSPSTTHDAFPLNLSGRAHITL